MLSTSLIYSNLEDYILDNTGHVFQKIQIVRWQTCKYRLIMLETCYGRTFSYISKFQPVVH